MPRNRTKHFDNHPSANHRPGNRRSGTVSLRSRCIGAAVAIAATSFATCATADAAAVWEYVDATGDGVLDSAIIDWGGDGLTDIAYSDLDQNGTWDVVSHDTDGNGTFEWVFADTAGPGHVWMHDATGDGQLDTVFIDRDGNQRYEAIVHDANGDLVFEWQSVDLLWSDGVADTWSQVGTTGGQRVLDQISVNHISTMTAIEMLSRAEGLS